MSGSQQASHLTFLLGSRSLFSLPTEGLASRARFLLISLFCSRTAFEYNLCRCIFSTWQRCKGEVEDYGKGFKQRCHVPWMGGEQRHRTPKTKGKKLFKGVSHAGHWTWLQKTKHRSAVLCWIHFQPGLIYSLGHASPGVHPVLFTPSLQCTVFKYSYCIRMITISDEKTGRGCCWSYRFKIIFRKWYNKN